MDFRARIRQSINNASLQAALDANAERRARGRAAAFASLPDWQERRQRAHAVRADVIAHLDSYLDQFIQNAQANGIIVHRAGDANEANKMVLEICAQADRYTGTHASTYTGRHVNTDTTSRRIDAKPSNYVTTKLIAKSKSMVSEEIELNHALESAGHRVVETDLGEYIVQLRGERPAHIITPAVHLRRGDVGQLFHEKLGIPYTEDISTLTNTARKVLREVFLSADVGLSGVNFGVAETGGICIVTNEGNGRMVTTLPRIHIALMGMERLVPSLDDLALMLSLLPRSATGQKLSVYTQLIHRPLSHQQRHIIILDNGRARLRESPLRESLYCIRCGACLNACPVFRELGGHAYGSVYPGPIGSVISAGLFGMDFAPLAQASSLCGACRDACPVDIDLPKLLTRVRAGYASPSPRFLSADAPPSAKRRGATGEGLTLLSKFGLSLYTRLARHPRLFAVSQRLAALATRLVSPLGDWLRLPAVTGWGYSKDFPRFASRPFRTKFHRQEATLAPGAPLPWAQVPGSAGENAKDFEKKEDEELGELRPFAVQKEKVESFIEELTALGGQVIITSNPTQSVIELLKSRQISHIHLEPDTLDESALQQAGIPITAAPDPALRVGVTKARCGLADTGSVLIADGEGSPLQASLLPEVHIAILRASQILPSLKNAMDLVKETSAAVFVTGPSRTADIEMTLTIGVHGSKELIVLLVDDSTGG